MKIDYKLKIIKEKTEHSPRFDFINPIINSNNKIFEIKADNGYGKTFLLNLIAFAFWSDELGDDHILRSLKKSISRYNLSDQYDLNYDINFDFPNGKKLVLSKENGRGRLAHFEGEPPLSPIILQKIVTVLFDVPSNPSERLNAVISDLTIWNNKLYEKIKSYWELLRKVQFEFESIRNESLISDLESEIANLKIKIDKASEKVADEKKVITYLSNIYGLDSLYNKVKSRTTLEGQIENLTKRFKKLKKPTGIIKKDDNLIRLKQRELSSKKAEFTRIIIELIRHISENNEIELLISNNETLSKQYSFIKDPDLFDLITDSEDNVELVNRFVKNVESLSDEILRFILKEESGKRYVIHNFLSLMLKQIDDLIENQAIDILEDITLSTTSEIKDEIARKLKTYEIKNYSEVSIFLKKGIKIKPILIDTFKLKRQISRQSEKKEIDSDGERYYQVLGQLDDKKNKRKVLDIEITKSSGSLANNLKIEDATYLKDHVYLGNLISRQKRWFEDNDGLSGPNPWTDIKAMISKRNVDLKILEDDLNVKLGTNDLKERKLSVEKGKNPSNYSKEEQEKINKFEKIFKWTVNNLGDYNGIISDIENLDSLKIEHEENQKFIALAGSIIAYSMSNRILRADGDYIGFNYYDMVSQTYHCENGVVINKDDISTGLASANYLKQKIENVEGEYVIVLLDEIGNMDSNTLEEVIKSIKKLENQGRLLLAILTQPKAAGITINEY